MKPLLAACTAQQSAACSDVLHELRNPYFLGGQPAGTESSGWVDAWQAEPSAYAVAAHTTADVAAAVKFARTHNLRLVVKGGGHSYLGGSSAPDSLLVWMRPMDAITLHDRFVGHGCNGHPAMPAGTGARWLPVYTAVTTEAGRYVQGGGCTTVGVAGHVLGNGFGSFSKCYGAAGAALLEAEIVTADGAVRIANACTNPDLFWALKGGGSCSFGVVTRLTLRTRELPDFVGFAFGKIKETSDDAFHWLLDRFTGFYAASLFNPHWGESVAFGADNSLALVQARMSQKRASPIPTGSADRSVTITGDCWPSRTATFLVACSPRIMASAAKDGAWTDSPPPEPDPVAALPFRLPQSARAQLTPPTSTAGR